jgi:ribose 5-phosphate isomerase B
MIIYIGSDHRGFTLKEGLFSYLKDSGYEVHDCGDTEYNDQDDYPDFISVVARYVSRDPSQRGIVLCGSGVGACVVANKFDKVRCSLCFTPDHAMAARHDDDANVLAIPADFIVGDMAKKIVSTWLQSPFNGGDAYVRRLQKISDIEFENKQSV